MPSLPSLGLKPWKQALEDWLLVSHNSDGTLKGGGATSGTLASRPAASSVSGGFYYATDQDVLYLSNGTSWLRQGFPAGITSRVYSDTVPTGWVAYDGTNLPASTGIYADLATHLGGVAKPDTRERVLVSKGTIADHDAIGDNDGLPVGQRGIVHNSTPALAFAGTGGNTAGRSAAHYHGVNGNTGGRSADHTHQIWTRDMGDSHNGWGRLDIGNYDDQTGWMYVPGATTSGESVDHSHAVNINSGTESVDHSHAFTPVGTISGSIGPGGTRPTDRVGFITFSVVIAKL